MKTKKVKLPVEKVSFWKELLKDKRPCTHSFKAVRKVLKKMGATKKEVLDSLSLTRDNSGFCDCEAWLNAAEGIVGTKTYDSLCGWRK